jgi:hypothetical protein
MLEIYRHFIQIIIAFLVLAFIIIKLLPVSNISTYSCAHFQVFGFGCPGCGFIRAIYCLLQFNFKEALKYNYTVFFVLPLFSIEVASLIKKSNGLNKIKNYTYYAFLLSLLLLYLKRIYNYLNI